MNNTFNFLGKKSNEPTKQLDTFDTPANVSIVKFEGDELSSFCPVTHQPDFYEIVIEYSPDKLCIESKSLKLYLWSFREEAVFAETLAHTVADDVFAAISPKWCKIQLTQNVRGGLKLSVVAERKNNQL